MTYCWVRLFVLVWLCCRWIRLLISSHHNLNFKMQTASTNSGHLSYPILYNPIVPYLILLYPTLSYPVLFILSNIISSHHISSQPIPSNTIFTLLLHVIIQLDGSVFKVKNLTSLESIKVSKYNFEQLSTENFDKHSIRVRQRSNP